MHYTCAVTVVYGLHFHNLAIPYTCTGDMVFANDIFMHSNRPAKFAKIFCHETNKPLYSTYVTICGVYSMWPHLHTS